MIFFLFFNCDKRKVFVPYLYHLSNFRQCVAVRGGHVLLDVTHQVPQRVGGALALGRWQVNCVVLNGG